MCYYLFGGVNTVANREDVEKVQGESFQFCAIPEGGIKRIISGSDSQYRIIHGMCDCDLGIGEHDYGSPDLPELLECLQSMRNVRDIEWVDICYKWFSDTVEDERTIHIGDVNIPFLADMDVNCMYKIAYARKE